MQASNIPREEITWAKLGVDSLNIRDRQLFIRKDITSSIHLLRECGCVEMIPTIWTTIVVQTRHFEGVSARTT